MDPTNTKVFGTTKHGEVIEMVLSQFMTEKNFLELVSHTNQVFILKENNGKVTTVTGGKRDGIPMCILE